MKMRYRPAALGYLRTDVSGIGQLWDEERIRRIAERSGYDFCGMVVYDPRTGKPPLAWLRALANRLDVTAVIAPGPDHFVGGRIPDALMARVEVITVGSHYLAGYQDNSLQWAAESAPST
ncbi:hypothetical protein [Nocardia crassostreae]|uniref:hypothetical protein n=1 Tax=Nocardia crassostreae TaxID=53428 RepID=UPI00082CF149|nr:hypothetical protein [Nocardia crassostreae]